MFPHREKINSSIKPAIRTAQNKLPRYKEEIFYNEGVETLGHIAQRRERWSSPGNTKNQIVQSSDLAGDVLAHCRGV